MRGKNNILSPKRFSEAEVVGLSVLKQFSIKHVCGDSFGLVL